MPHKGVRVASFSCHCQNTMSGLIFASVNDGAVCLIIKSIYEQAVSGAILNFYETLEHHSPFHQ